MIGLANLIREGKIVEAHSVRAEITFYEDVAGVIHWGSNQEVDERFLSVVPDITFFNIEGKPILFIELVATHGIDAEKSAKLRRLGIDTIQVKVPRDSPEAIENSFKTTSNTKWIYNYVESSTQYVYVPTFSGEGIPSIDEQQRKFLEESFKCRKSQISNLIRTITRCLESQRYGTIESEFRQEISRVETNTIEHQSKLESLREECRKRALIGIGPRVEEAARDKERFEIEEGDIDRNFKDLERRYRQKKSDIEREQREIDQKIRNLDEGRSHESEGEGINGNSIERRRREIERLTKELRGNIRLANDRIEQFRKEEEELPDRNNKLRNTVINRFDKLTKSSITEIERIGRVEEELPIEFYYKEESLPGEFREQEEIAITEFERGRKQTSQTILSKDGRGNTRLHQRIRGILASRESLNDIEQEKLYCKRNRSAWNAFKSGAYEHWVE